MTQEHPITPPPELVREWIAEWSLGDSWAQVCQNVALVAARWGADQQLEMDVTWVALQTSNQMSSKRLIAEMRPKPPSLKEQALCHLESFAGSIETLGMDSDLIRRALESLPD